MRILFRKLYMRATRRSLEKVTRKTIGRRYQCRYRKHFFKFTITDTSWRDAIGCWTTQNSEIPHHVSSCRRMRLRIQLLGREEWQFHVSQLSGSVSGRNAMPLRLQRLSVGRHTDWIPCVQFTTGLHCWVSWWLNGSVIPFNIISKRRIALGAYQISWV